MAEKKLSYKEALEEIESILNYLESGEMEVDELTEKVKRVTGLIKMCREKLHKTENQIDELLQEET